MSNPKPTTVQTLIFSKAAGFNSGTAREWARRNAFSPEKVDETGTSFRLRQHDVSAFVQGSFRTITLTKGVEAVIGRPKSEKIANAGDASTLGCPCDELSAELSRRGNRVALLDAYDFLLGRDPPTEIRIFRAGSNPSTKGDYKFTATSAALVMSQFEKMGRRVTWDYDHGSLRKDAIDPSKSAKSAGSGRLELRAGELWMVDIEWTPEGGGSNPQRRVALLLARVHLRRGASARLADQRSPHE